MVEGGRGGGAKGEEVNRKQRASAGRKGEGVKEAVPAEKREEGVNPDKEGIAL